MWAVLRADARLEGVAPSVATVRAFVRQTLAGWGADGLEWAAMTVASELATNAVLHAGTDYVVTLALDGEILTIDVSDGSPRAPVRRRYDTDATTGRGLALVSSLCASWHVERTPAGKVVHCVITESADGGQRNEAGRDDLTGHDDEAALLERFSDEPDDTATSWGRVA
jgi:anti-sigma regulatory factor (Ser/Thr protein kinase)